MCQNCCSELCGLVQGNLDIFLPLLKRAAAQVSVCMLLKRLLAAAVAHTHVCSIKARENLQSIHTSYMVPSECCRVEYVAELMIRRLGGDAEIFR